MRVIDDEANVLGVMDLPKALELARQRELDLVEVAPNAVPPVCKVMDFGKYVYRQQKVDRKHRAQQKQSEVKGIRLGFRTGPHDVEVKAKQARKFLEARHVVKVVMIFRGREITHKNLGMEKMKFFYEILQDVAKVDESPKSQGNQMFMILSPQVGSVNANTGVRAGSSEKPSRSASGPPSSVQSPPSELPPSPISNTSHETQNP